MIKVSEFIENELLKQTPTITYEHDDGIEEKVEIKTTDVKLFDLKNCINVECSGYGYLENGTEIEVKWDFNIGLDETNLEGEYYEIEVK